MTADSAHEFELEPKNPDRRGLRKGVYLIPSVFTAANIGMGFYAVMAAARGFQFVGTGVDEDLLKAAAYLDNAAKAIGWALLFDMLDGRIARMTKTTTEIGVQLDSIADVVTFGLAPAVLAYVWGYGATLKEGSDLHSLAWFLSFMYLMCGAFRLARFNVQASRPRILAEGTIKMDKKSFVGLPIPVAGGLIAAIIHFAPVPLIAYGPRTREDLFVSVDDAGRTAWRADGQHAQVLEFQNRGNSQPEYAHNNSRLGVGMLIFLYSRYVLLAIVIGYILNGLLSRFVWMFRRRPNVDEDW